jgi:propionyl-CoA synthetase
VLESVRQQWSGDLAEFWQEQAGKLEWSSRWTSVLDGDDAMFHRWFAGGYLNAAQNCLVRHVAAGRGTVAAIVFDSPLTDTKRTLTYAALLDEVTRFAGVLTGLRINTGETVLIYMPAVPETVIAMLACAARPDPRRGARRSGDRAA